MLIPAIATAGDLSSLKRSIRRSKRALLHHQRQKATLGLTPELNTFSLVWVPDWRRVVR